MQSSQLPGTGQFTVCGDSFRVVVSSGVVRKHGGGEGHLPCAGSGKLPMTISNLDLQNVKGDSFAISTVAHSQGT